MVADPQGIKPFRLAPRPKNGPAPLFSPQPKPGHGPAQNVLSNQLASVTSRWRQHDVASQLLPCLTSFSSSWFPGATRRPPSSSSPLDSATTIPTATVPVIRAHQALDVNRHAVKNGVSFFVFITALDPSHTVDFSLLKKSISHC
ncbi:hypothetical protein C1H46_026149 [Malus baccata]|uniref:Uncharacterized protein n=1 Tax=Malus baccata TaxID=106549 RepID=A0A540LPE1_MALBA|nr:hypothetical protein C1H46_026149 [Malus baccata]